MHVLRGSYRFTRQPAKVFVKCLIRFVGIKNIGLIKPLQAHPWARSGFLASMLLYVRFR
ncbi:MAG: hypothetical protein ACI97K_003319 [Glaciecola sp.]|jgi:hypothetical protein